MDYSGHSALVSGGAGGLGGATSRHLHALGMSVVIFEPDRDRGEALAAELGERAISVAGDQNNDAEVGQAITEAQKFGVFSVNINAAGLLIPTQATATIDGVPHNMDVFREMIEMHLFGPFNVARLCAAAFAANPADEDGQRGMIVNTASTGAYDGQPRQVAYAAAKSGIVGMTLSMARDLAEIGVRVNSIAPGPIWTPRLAKAPDELKQELTKNIAFPKRFGKAEEYASLVEGILRTPFLNGQTIRLDGAMSTPLTPMAPQSRET